MDLSPCSRVAVALARHLGGESRPPLDGAMRLDEDLGLDPLDLTLIALRLEQEHGAEFPLHRLDEVRTLADLDRLVERWARGARVRAA